MFSFIVDSQHKTIKAALLQFTNIVMQFVQRRLFESSELVVADFLTSAQICRCVVPHTPYLRRLPPLEHVLVLPVKRLLPYTMVLSEQ